MRNRYQRTEPSLEFLKLYLRDAQPTLSERLAEPDAAETRRVEAVASLRALARAELVRAGDPNRLGAIPHQLRQFLAIAGFRMLLSDNPDGALESFLGKKPRGRGRPAEDHDYRDIMITIDVALLHANGMSLTDAFRDVSERPGTPGVKRIEEIYLARDDLLVRAALEFDQWIMAGYSDALPPEIDGRKITPEQLEEYVTLRSAVCPSGMTDEDHQELWSFVRRTSFPA